MLRNISRDEQTKRKLLKAAGLVFARKGFRRATVREICLRAGVNVACIAYHYGGKAGLYESVLTAAHEEAMRRYPPDLGLPPEAPARERLTAYVHSFLLRLVGPDSCSWHGRIMNWELNEPTEVLSAHLRRSILPNVRILQSVVAEIVGCGEDDETTLLCAQSIVGQCRHYTLARPILAVLFPGLRQDARGIEQLATHIAAFSLAGLAHFREQGPCQGQPRTPGQDPDPGPEPAEEPGPDQPESGS